MVAGSGTADMSLYSVLGSPRLSYFENRWSSKAHTFELLGKTTGTRWRACAANGGGEGAPRQRGASARRETLGAAARVRRARAGGGGRRAGLQPRSSGASQPRRAGKRHSRIGPGGQALGGSGGGQFILQQGARSKGERPAREDSRGRDERRATCGIARRHGRAAATLGAGPPRRIEDAAHDAARAAATTGNPTSPRAHETRDARRRGGGAGRGLVQRARGRRAPWPRGGDAVALAWRRGEGSHCALRQSQRERRGRGHARSDASASAAAPGRLDDLTFCIGPPPLREAGSKSRGRGGRSTHLRGETPSARARGSWLVGTAASAAAEGWSKPPRGEPPDTTARRGSSGCGERRVRARGRRAPRGAAAAREAVALGAGRWALGPPPSMRKRRARVLGQGRAAAAHASPGPGGKAPRRHQGTMCEGVARARERGRRDDARRRGRAAAATGKPRRRNCTWEEACARECGERRAAPRDATDARRRRWAPSPRMGQRRV